MGAASRRLFHERGLWVRVPFPAPNRERPDRARSSGQCVSVTQGVRAHLLRRVGLASESALQGGAWGWELDGLSSCGGFWWSWWFSFPKQCDLPNCPAFGGPVGRHALPWAGKKSRGSRGALLHVAEPRSGGEHLPMTQGLDWDIEGSSGTSVRKCCLRPGPSSSACQRSRYGWDYGTPQC